MDIPKRLGIKKTDFRLVFGGSRIDYDATKEDANVQKHKRSLKEALPILVNAVFPINRKPFLTHDGIERNGEIRHKHMGLDKEGKIVFFVTTMRSDETVRVISFRRANRTERKVFTLETGYQEP
jgi:uncharacterized DUF497 family protein